VLQVIVVPRASRSRVVGEHDGRLKVQLAAAPVDGEANEELARMLSELLHISRTQVELVSGQGARRKTVRLRGLEPENLLIRLGVNA
jgi:uncharacterized protein (TIGR00251 family)